MIHTKTRLEPEEEELINGQAVQSVLKSDPKNALFFDIETTGLSADTAFVFLIGCISFEEGGWNLNQYMIRFVQEERQLLTSFFEQAEKARILVHFNGSHFDIPFINKRASLIGMDSNLSSLSSVDLYLRYRPLKNLLGMKRMNQSSLEAWAGWERKDELSGKDMIGKYWSYSVNKDKETETLILGHNRDDLKGMLRVFALEGYLTLSRGEILSEVRAKEEYPGSFLSLSFTCPLPLVRPLTVTKEIFPDGPLPSDSSGSPARYALFVKESEGSLTVPIFTGRLRHYFSDYKNYYYLPVEHKVIHKSVASFVEKEYKEHATPENCYVEQTGRFLPQPMELFTPPLKENYDSKALFFSYENGFCAKKEDLYVYVQALLKFIFQK